MGGGHGTPSNFNFDVVQEDRVVVGSCLKTEADIDKVKAAGVDFIFSLQDEADLKKLNIDLDFISTACESRGLRYLNFGTNETDEVALRQKLPEAVAAFGAESKNSVGLVHCNGGRQRAPTIATAYLYWLGGLQLTEALASVTSARESEPKVGVLRGATWDLLSGLGFDGEDVKARILEEGGSGELTAEEREAIVKKLSG